MGARGTLSSARRQAEHHDLGRWYRQGGDVQTHLPKLALYMPRVSIVSTAYYLHFIPEVATLARQRFERPSSSLIDPRAP